ncbi:MAG: hypothetical protein MUF15_06920, partial [Acidobacteria bacterium]|nr:hypothetical protein [Acidobacteriota bacterium]
MDFKKWFDEAIGHSALNVLNELAAQFKDDQGNVSWRNAVTIFTEFCSGTLDSSDQQKVNDIIAALGLTSQYDALKNFWQKIPQELKDINKILRETNDPITWRILAEDGKSISTGDFIGPANTVLNFTAGSAQDKIDFMLSLQALDSACAKQTIDTTCSNDQRILAMGLDGIFSVSAGASLKSGFFNISGNINTTGTTAGLDYYYLDDGKWLFTEALFHNVPHLVSPFDAKAIASAKTNGLEAVKMNIAGALNASINIGINAAYGPSFIVPGSKLGLDIGNTTVAANMQANLGFTSGLNLEGVWQLRAKPKDNYIISLAVDNDLSQSIAHKISLAASVGLTGLDKVGNALIAKYLPSAQPLLDQLEKFENPGSILKAEITKQLDHLLHTSIDKTLQDNLIKVLVGDETAAGLADVLGNAAESALNSRLEVLAGNAKEAGNKILTDIAAKLKLPKEISDQLVAKASDELGKLLDNIKTGLENQINTIITNNKTKLIDIFKPLETVGQSVDQLCGELDNLAKKLLAPVIDFLNIYLAQRQKIVDFVANSANYSVSLNISRALATEKESITVLEFDIDTREENALKRYKEMMIGQFDNALSDARKAPGGSGGITLTGGTLTKVLHKKLTMDVNFKIFGSEINASNILSSDVILQVNAATGDVLTAASKGIMEKNLKAFGEEQSITFINMLGIPGAITKGDAGGTYSAMEKLISGTGLVLKYSDDDLKRSELEDYMGSAQKADIISRGSLDAVLKRYDELALVAQKTGKKMQAYITLSMPLTSTDVQTMMTYDDKIIRQKALENQLKYCFKDDRDRNNFNQYLARWFRDNPPHTLEDKINKIAAKGAFAGGVMYENSTDPLLFHGDPDVVRMNHYVGLARSIGTNADNFVKIIQYVRESADMTITIENINTVRDKIEEFNEDTNKYLKSWLKTSG